MNFYCLTPPAYDVFKKHVIWMAPEKLAAVETVETRPRDVLSAGPRLCREKSHAALVYHALRVYIFTHKP